jgi:hypothetical protein
VEETRAPKKILTSYKEPAMQILRFFFIRSRFRPIAVVYYNSETAAEIATKKVVPLISNPATRYDFSDKKTEPSRIFNNSVTSCDTAVGHGYLMIDIGSSQH